MNDDLRKSAEQRVRGMDDNSYQKFFNHQNKVNAIVTLEDTNNMNKLVQDAERFSKAMTKAFDLFEGKDYEKLSTTFKKMQDYIKDLNNESNDAKKNAEIINKMVEDVLKIDGSKLNKEVANAIKKLIDGNKEVIETANEYKRIMKSSSETFGQNLMGNVKKVGDDLIKLANAFNLQKLVTGGTSLKDLQAMQGSFKIDMNLDSSGFMGVQKELLSQNKQILYNTGEAYLTASDTQNYMRSINEYSLKNYNQSTSLYKQIVTGNKYLSLSNQSLSSMVKATNQMADDSYMNKQMALLAALGTDSTLSENISGVADFISTNLAGVNARYSNGDQMVKDAAALYSTNDKYMGANSSLYTELLSEIMNTNNFANLSDKTQTLLNMSGMTTDLQQMMQNGQVDLQKIMLGLNEGLLNFSKKAGGKDSMELYGLGDWVTAVDSYERNKDNYLSDIKSELSAMNKVDLSSASSMEEAIALLREQNDNKSLWTKFTDSAFTFFGIQNQNWTELSGAVQLISTAISGTIAAASTYTAIRTMNIKNIVSYIAGKMNLSGDRIPGQGIGGYIKGLQASKTMASGAKLLGGAGFVTAGLGLGLYQAAKTKDYDGGSLGGFFLGTGAKDRSIGENAVSLLGNTAKYTAIGAGIGTIFPGIGTAVGAAVGAGAGILTGVIGMFRDSVKENTDALTDNTKAYESNDSFTTKSYLNKLISNNNTRGEGSPGISYGVGSGSTSNSGGYPWTITSPFGPRTLSNGDSSFHNGVDFGIKTGTPIGAPVSGKVIYAVTDNRNTYPKGPTSAGSGINIQGNDGIMYQFWHLSSVGVKQNQTVSPGDVIGLSGNTGYSTGAHLHFGTKIGGKWQNPLPHVTSGLFKADGKTYNASASNSDTYDANTPFVSSAGIKQYLTKENIFKQPSTSGTGAAPDITPSTAGLATSSDIDRLIEAIKTINTNQNEQRDFMRALAGKNTFVYGRE